MIVSDSRASCTEIISSRLSAMTVSMIAGRYCPSTAPTISCVVPPISFSAAKSRLPPAAVLVPGLMPTAPL